MDVLQFLRQAAVIRTEGRQKVRTQGIQARRWAEMDAYSLLCTVLPDLLLDDPTLDEPTRLVRAFDIGSLTTNDLRAWVLRSCSNAPPAPTVAAPSSTSTRKEP